MRTLYFFTYIMLGFLLFSCKQDSFQKEEQNLEDFTKLVPISDLVYLHGIDPNKEFADPLYIEAIVNGTDTRSIHVQDASALALRVFIANAHEFNPDDLVRINVGGEVLNVDNSHYILNNPSIAVVGKSVGTAVSVSLEDLADEAGKFTSKLVSLSDLTFREKQLHERFAAYLIEQDVSSDINFWINVPEKLVYDMPMSISSATGFVTYENSNIYIHIRTQDDIREVYVEPTMMEKVLMNSNLVKNVLQSDEIEISSGVKKSEMSYINDVDLLTSCTVLEVDLNNPKVRLEPGSPNDAGPPFNTLQNLTTMAGHRNTHYAGTSWRVLAAITGDIHQAGSPNVVRGPFVKDGNILKTDFWDPTHGFLGLVKKGEGVVFGSRTEFEETKESLLHAVGGVILLKNGEPLNLPGNRDPRAAVGYTANGKVYLFVGNGRYTSVSNGFTRNEIANFLKALGCEGGLYLMEGGASVGIIENKNGDYEVFSRTHATNISHNPPLASSWMVVTDRTE